MAKSTAVLTILVFLTGFMASCDIRGIGRGNIPATVPSGIEFDRERFERERVAWEALGLAKYSVIQDYRSSAIGQGIARIVVQDNAIIHTETLFPLSLCPICEHPTCPWCRICRICRICPTGHRPSPIDPSICYVCSRCPYCPTNSFPLRFPALTISELFDWIYMMYEYERRVYEKGGSFGFRIMITYNREFHFPEAVRISRNWIVQPGPGAGFPSYTLLEFIPLTSEVDE